MSLYDSIRNWRILQSTGKKERTRQYHEEIATIILSHLPSGKNPNAFTELDMTNFVTCIAHYSAPRFNAIISAVQTVIPAARSIKRRPVRVKDREVVNHLQFNELLSELDKRPKSHAGLIIRFLAVTGLRISSARRLRWKDVRDNCIVCPGEIMKNGKMCVVPFLSGTKEALDRLRTINPNPIGDELILPNLQCRRALATACRNVNIRHLTHHDFRHLFTTRCIESGVDIPTVAKWRGDSDRGEMLVRVYVHISDAHSLKMAAQVKI